MSPIHYILLPFVLLMSTISATATVDGCSVSHTTNANVFRVVLHQVPSVSASTVCGHFQDQLNSLGDQNGIDLVDLQCQTESGSMNFTAYLNKQSPQAQLEILEEGLRNAFGGQGLVFSTGQCNIAGIPSKRFVEVEFDGKYFPHIPSDWI